MASPQADLNQCTSLLEACSLSTSVRENVNTRPTRRVVYGPPVWDTFTWIKARPQPNLLFKSEAELFKWCSENVHSLDLSCEETKFERPSGLYDELRREGLAEALTCHHRDGSFDLSPGTVARCLYIANVISLSCFLFCLRISPFQYEDRSVLDMSGLTDELSSLSDKWKWSGDSCENIFRQWILYIEDAEFKEEAIKLLYQWTLLPLSCVLVSAQCEMDGASVGDDQYEEACRVIKWADELCNFLEKYRTLFQHSDDTEFLYDDICNHHLRTAALHLILGNHKRATELLETPKGMLEEIEENDLMVTRYGKGKIAYLKPEPIEILVKKGKISKLLKDTSKSSESDSFVYLKQIGKEVRDRGLDFDKFTSERGWIRPPFHRQLYDIIDSIVEKRFSEAREIFKQLDLKQGRSNRAILRSFLEFLNSLHFPPNFGAETMTQSNLFSVWESFCEEQVLLLDVCEDLGDRQLTAKLLQHYGIMLGKHSLEKVTLNQQRHQAQDASTLQHWLGEELNLQFTLLAPECVQSVISCLRDPCSSDEHKRENLPDMLKGLRLMKRSIEIYSGLLHNWTQGTSNEVEWLKLLESQKTVREALQSYLLEIAQLCSRSLMQESKDPSASASNNYLVVADNALLESNHASRGAADDETTVTYSKVVTATLHAIVTSTLVWVERGRARTLLNQLGPWYNMKHRDGNPGSLKEELIEFDNDEQAAMSSILSCLSACDGEPLYVEYVTQTLADVKAVAFMIDKQRKVGIVFNDYEGDQVEKLVNNFYEMVEDFHKTKNLPRRLEAGVVVKLHNLLEKLYDILVRPLLMSPRFQHLGPKATLIFVPDKMLYKVPFALLRDKRTQKFLFQLLPIAVAPSLRGMQHCEMRLRDLDRFPLKPEGCVLAVGNAAYEMNRLPGTGKELEHLRSCFPGRVKILEKDEATRAKFLELVKEASRSEEQHVFACIHLGVHGHWREIKPGDDEEENQYKTGSLQFAKPPPPPQHSAGGFEGPTTDISRGDMSTGQPHTSVLELEFRSKAAISRYGERQGSAFDEVGAVARAADLKSTAAEDMLPSEDIVKGGLQWRTRLVVLSACNSSRGQGYSDGEVNLPRALMIAGVPAAVVSQWKVVDVGSPMLMKAFYENLRYGQNVATALQSAMIELSSDSESESANNIFEWGPFLVWGLPTVQLPEELWTENARKALPAKKQAELLRVKFNHIHPDSVKVVLLDMLKAVDTFLESASKANVLEEEAIFDTIYATETLLTCLQHDLYFSAEITALAEEIFIVNLPFEQIQRVELELEKRRVGDWFMSNFRQHVMYTQAMKGSHQIALDYANILLEIIQNAYGCWYDESIVQAFRKNEELVRQERAVILRLMGKYEEALREFDDLLAHGEDYECLIQMSYLKHLMEDKCGAFEYARRAKKIESPEVNKPGYYAFVLGFKALPDEYRQWLRSVT